MVVEVGVKRSSDRRECRKVKAGEEKVEGERIIESRILLTSSNILNRRCTFYDADFMSGFCEGDGSG